MSAPLKKNDPAKAREFFTAKMAFTTGPVEVSNNIKEGTAFNLVDVREAEDFRKGHLPGAINLPHDRWNTYEGLRKDALNVLYCYTSTCHLAATAAVDFAAKGYSVMEMDGGFEAWKDNDLEVETEASGSRSSSSQRERVLA